MGAIKAKSIHMLTQSEQQLLPSLIRHGISMSSKLIDYLPVSITSTIDE